MKTNTLFEECLAEVAAEVKEEVRINIEIADRIYELLKEKQMTQRDLATFMGKRESEISRWLTGHHGFTTKTLAKISTVLGEPLIQVKRDAETKYVFISLDRYVSGTEARDGSYTNKFDGYLDIKQIS